ncbi:odorant receptor 4-like [Orussus abietinus]|uniref:odorant receptor 4-like n=1 Tax=Orussus abietinus TaxID=222816 RepID=UPI0006254779|nr:odorant receptor 4-like [Orussus abietinus]
MIVRNKKIATITFKEFIGPSVIMMRCIGMPFMQCVLTGENKMPTILETIVCALCITGTWLVIAVEFRTLLFIWQDNPMHALNSVPTIISVVLSAAKGVRLIQKRVELRNLLQKMAIHWENSVDLNSNAVDEMLDKLFVTRNIYFTIIVGGFIFYTLPRYIDITIQYIFMKTENRSYDHTQMVYPIMYPFPLKTAFVYFLVNSLEQAFVVIAVIMWVSCDILFAHLTTFTAIHLRLLRHKLEKVFNDKGMARPDNIVELKVIVLIGHHLELLSICNAIESIFSPVVMLTMLLCATNMCVCMYQMEKMLSMGDYIEVVLNWVHLSALFMMIVTFCWFATMLTDQTEGVGHGAYESSWFGCDRSMKTLLMVIMRRSQTPFFCTAYGFFPLSLNQVATIFSSALSYFSILRSMT